MQAFHKCYLIDDFLWLKNLVQKGGFDYSKFGEIKILQIKGLSSYILYMV